MCVATRQRVPERVSNTPCGEPQLQKPLKKNSAMQQVGSLVLVTCLVITQGKGPTQYVITVCPSGARQDAVATCPQNHPASKPPPLFPGNSCQTQFLVSPIARPTLYLQAWKHLITSAKRKAISNQSAVYARPGQFYRNVITST